MHAMRAQFPRVVDTVLYGVSNTAATHFDSALSPTKDSKPSVAGQRSHNKPRDFYE